MLKRRQNRVTWHLLLIRVTLSSDFIIHHIHTFFIQNVEYYNFSFIFYRLRINQITIVNNMNTFYNLLICKNDIQPLTFERSRSISLLFLRIVPIAVIYKKAICQRNRCEIIAHPPISTCSINRLVSSPIHRTLLIVSQRIFSYCGYKISLSQPVHIF